MKSLSGNCKKKKVPIPKDYPVPSVNNDIANLMYLGSEVDDLQSSEWQVRSESARNIMSPIKFDKEN